MSHLEVVAGIGYLGPFILFEMDYAYFTSVSLVPWKHS